MTSRVTDFFRDAYRKQKRKKDHDVKHSGSQNYYSFLSLP